MELINNRSTLPTIRHSNPLAIAVADKYGPAENFIRKFNPDKAGYCARHLPEAIANDCPTMVVAAMAYGEPSITALLITHISATVVRMGEEMQMTPEDVRFIAEGILGNEKARLLTMASVLAFFYRMACGEFKIYGKLTPRTFLEAFNEYAEKALATERQLKAEAAKLKERQAQQEHDAVAITFNEWISLRGYGDEMNDPLNYANMD
jgi:hypothetical protein